MWGWVDVSEGSDEKPGEKASQDPHLTGGLPCYASHDITLYIRIILDSHFRGNDILFEILAIDYKFPY